MRELIANGNIVADWAEFLQSQWTLSAKPTLDLEKVSSKLKFTSHILSLYLYISQIY
jgi:hypothetical protein